MQGPSRGVLHRKVEMLQIEVCSKRQHRPLASDFLVDRLWRSFGNLWTAYVQIAGGFYGSGVKTFLAWLNDKVQQDKEGNQRPDPDASDTDAVELVTWHRSKGREWPIVLVGGWDADVKPRLPEVGTNYEKFDNLDTVLDEARVSFIPRFAAPEGNDRFLAPMLDDTIVSAKRLIYVALTRVRERLILEWHSHLAGSKRTTYHSVFQDQTGIELGDEGIEVGGEVFPCMITRNNGTAPDLPSGVGTAEYLPTFGRRAIDAAPM